jgi:hypothetical protein
LVWRSVNTNATQQSYRDAYDFYIIGKLFCIKDFMGYVPEVLKEIFKTLCAIIIHSLNGLAVGAVQ